MFQTPAFIMNRLLLLMCLRPPSLYALSRPRFPCLKAPLYLPLPITLRHLSAIIASCYYLSVVPGMSVLGAPLSVVPGMSVLGAPLSIMVANFS